MKISRNTLLEHMEMHGIPRRTPGAAGALASRRLDIDERYFHTIDHPDVYSSHYGGFDNPQNAKLAFWTWYASGLRVFDISNPSNPTEIAYYNPPPIATVTNNEFILGPSPVFYDYTTSYTHYNPSNGDIWFVSEQNGFQIVRLTKTAGPMSYPQHRHR